MPFLAVRPTRVLFLASPSPTSEVTAAPPVSQLSFSTDHTTVLLFFSLKELVRYASLTNRNASLHIKRAVSWTGGASAVLLYHYKHFSFSAERHTLRRKHMLTLRTCLKLHQSKVLIT